MRMMANRHSRRVDFRVPVQIQSFISGSTYRFSGETRNISEQGLFFVAKEALEVGAQIKVQVELPGHLTRKPEVPYLYLSKVIYVTQRDGENGEYGIGIQFICFEDAISR
jgi:hypothetical protein